MMEKNKPPPSLVVVPMPPKKVVTAEDWTGEQAVQDFLKEIQEGKTKPDKIIILWFTRQEDGSMTPHRWFAKVNQAEEIALLELAKHIGLEEWKK